MPPHPVLPLSQLLARIPAKTVRMLVGTVCRNFDAASNGHSTAVLNLSNDITQPSGCMYVSTIQTCT